MEEKQSTKDKILFAALSLFAEKGFEASSVDEIAETAGVKGPAIYYHYKSKDDILDCLVNKIEVYYSENFGSSSKIIHIPASLEELMEFSLIKIHFTIEDEIIRKMRKLITIEQYRNEQFAELATIHFITSLEKMYTYIFSEMMKKGILKNDDAEILSAIFVAPVTQLIHLVDREPIKKDYALERIQIYMEHFIKTYGC